MECYDLLSDAQSQTQSGTLVGPNLREQVEDVRQRLGFESASGVTHTHCDRRLRPRRGQMDPAPRFSVLHSIVEQIRQYLPEAFWIGIDPQRRRRDRDDKVMAARSDRGARVQRGVCDRLPDIHSLQLQRQLAFRPSRRIDEILDQASHLAGLPLDDLRSAVGCRGTRRRGS